ncbi:type 2 periplasmic-binding domain-containing protein [Microlunatus elymi]|nr:extracellular solute-binding protein [Microlunatus elymi]
MSSPFTPKARLSRRSLLTGAAVAASAIALPSALTACSGGDKTKSPSGGSNLPKDLDKAKPVEFGAETEGILYPSPYKGPKARTLPKFADGSTSFRVVVPQDATVVGDWNKNKFSQIMEDTTGVKVQYDAVLVTTPDGSSDLTKINAMIASGDLPDAFMSVGLSRDQISLYGQQGLFTPLEDLIRVYAPGMREMYEQNPDIKQANLAQDGHIYNFGGVNDCFHCRSAGARAFVNKKYLEKVGADMPTTTEEFRSLLQLFKKKNPSGKPGFLPFMGGDVTYDPVDLFMMGPFIYNPGAVAGQAYLKLNNGQVQFVANTDEWREGLRFMRQLYDDGTLTKQTFTIKGDDLTKLGNNGLIGVCRAFNWAAWITMTPGDNQPWEDYIPMTPLKGPQGVQVASWTYGANPFTTSLVITKNCKNPEQLVQWADAQLDLLRIQQSYRGDQPRDWRWAEKGELGETRKQAIYGPGTKSEGAPAGTTWNQYGIMYRSADYRAAGVTDPTVPNLDLIAEKVYQPHAQPEDQFLPSLLFDPSVTAQRGDTEANLTKQVSINMAKFATAELDINSDTAWKNYTSTLDKMGLPAYVKQAQEAYDKRPK